MGEAPRPRVFTIGPGPDFLETLAQALLDGRLVGPLDPADPFALSRVTLFLPTRRAARAFSSVLARHLAPRVVLLPRILPLGDIEDAELVELAESAGDRDAALLPPAIEPRARLLILTQLVQAWARSLGRGLNGSGEAMAAGATPGDALALAGDLANLLDMLAIEGRGVGDLKTLAPDALAASWAVTLEFLRIVSEHWPALLGADGLMDIAERRDVLLRRRAVSIASSPDAVIAAGSTGSMPATAALLAAIARLPRGAVVLPGLDTELDDASAAAVRGDAERDEPEAASHPQALLLRLIKQIGIAPGDVVELAPDDAAGSARRMLLREAMRPAATTEHWSSLDVAQAEQIDRGLEGMALIEAQDEREEALAIAVALRETIESAGKTAALVTPDRALAERVSAALGRWGIEIDDSAGKMLSRAPAGVLARLVVEAVSSDFDPVTVLDLLADPAACFGLARSAVRDAAAVLDVGVLRGRYVARGCDALLAALATGQAAAADSHAHRRARALNTADWEGAAGLLGAIADALAPLAALAEGNAAHPLPVLAKAHREAIARVRQTAPEIAMPEAGPDDEALSALLDALATATAAGITLTLADYPPFLTRLMADETVRPPRRSHPRVKLWGLLEARLLHADRIVLGGLNETVWPPQPRTDAFLNRGMRKALGLPAPERRVGQSAHDLVSAAGGGDVVLSRAHKNGGDPTVPSRFLQRLEAFAARRAESWGAARARGTRFVTLARRLDHPAGLVTRPALRPDPRPPPALIPTTLSITDCEKLVRDPYAIFVKSVLKLAPLDDYGAMVDARLWGTIIHEAVAAAALVGPAHRIAAFTSNAEQLFVHHGVEPMVLAFWRPRITRLARHVTDWELQRRPLLTAVAVETAGRFVLPMPDGVAFELTGRADRIETRRDGTAVLVDFKTGESPSAKQVKSGLAPQLTLEAAMVMAGAFGDVAKRAVADLVYVRLGSRFEERSLATGKEALDIAGLALRDQAGLMQRICDLRTQKRGFRSRDFARLMRDDDPVQHLARADEWAVDDSEDAS